MTPEDLRLLAHSAETAARFMRLESHERADALLAVAQRGYDEANRIEAHDKSIAEELAPYLAPSVREVKPCNHEYKSGRYGARYCNRCGDGLDEPRIKEQHDNQRQIDRPEEHGYYDPNIGLWVTTD